MQHKLSIPSMKCDGCVNAVEEALSGVGAKDICVDLAEKVAVFEADSELQACITAVANAGFVAQGLS